MKITNNFNLPESLVNIIKKDIREPKDGEMHVTELVGSPLIRKLRIKHWNELEEDVSDRLWALLGTSVHYILEKGAPEDAFGEEELTAHIGGITIIGKSDLYHNKGIEDWKVTSVYSFLLGMKPEWEAQQNIYKWLWKENGFPVETLNINAILRDWLKSKILTDSNYPKIPFQSMKVNVWNYHSTIKYILNRIVLHAEKPPPECTPGEKWTRPTTYAVMKVGQKKAKRVLSSNELAEEWLSYQENLKDLFVEERKGTNVRCESYCSVKNFCPYYNKREKNNSNHNRRNSIKQK